MSYFVLASDYAQGGDLYKLLDTYWVLPIVLVQLLVAEIALALGKCRNTRTHT